MVIVVVRATFHLLLVGVCPIISSATLRLKEEGETFQRTTQPGELSYERVNYPALFWPFIPVRLSP